MSSSISLGSFLQLSNLSPTSPRLSSSARASPLALAYTGSSRNSSLSPSPQMKLSLCITQSSLIMAGHMPWRDSDWEPLGSLLPATVSHGVLMLRTSRMLFCLAYHPHSQSLFSRLVVQVMTRNRPMPSYTLLNGLKTSLVVQQREPSVRPLNWSGVMPCARCCTAGSIQPTPFVHKTPFVSILVKTHPTLPTAVLYTATAFQKWSPRNPSGIFNSQSAAPPSQRFCS